MQSLNDYCFEDRPCPSMGLKIALETVVMLGIIAGGAVLTLLSAPVLMFVK